MAAKRVSDEPEPAKKRMASSAELSVTKDASDQPYAARLRGPPFRPARPVPVPVPLDNRPRNFNGTLVSPPSVTYAPGTTLPLTIKAIDGKTYPVACPADSTLDYLKQLIAAATGITVDAQRIIAWGRQLSVENARIFHEYGIWPGGTLHLVTRISGD